jgi:VWFA-related protein
MCRLPSWRAGVLVVAAAMMPVMGAAQQAPPPPFRTETSLVTVDAVVVDDRGQPISGLGRDDFEVLDEGVTQRVEYFQAAEAQASRSASEQSEASSRRSRFAYATNVGTQAPATRSFVLVFDDLHLSREQGERARRAMVQFISTTLADGDLVSLIVPGAALRWHARIPEGREELLRIANGLEGRLQLEPTFERITDYEAYRIHVFQDEVVANQVDRRWQNYRQLGREPTNLASDRGFQPQERGGTAGIIKADIAIRAADTYSRTMARNRVTLGALRSMVEALEPVRGRKSVLLLSAGLIEDQEQVDGRQLVDAARRANVALYFIDARGIEAGSSFGTAQFGSPLDTRDIGAANAQIELEVQGAENLALDTGGFSVRNANDLPAGLSRIARELSSYYLLGFQPSVAGQPGAYRRLQVRLKRPGATIRARKGYHVSGAPPSGGATAIAADALQRATDSPYDLDTIPLRATSYVFGEAATGRALVTLALEADLRAFAFTARADTLTDVLELRIVATHLEALTSDRYDGQVQMTFPGATRFGEDSWHGIARDFTLAPGRYQARVVVRDANSGRVGAVTHAFDVPPLDQLRVTTPIVTDTVASPPDAGTQTVPRPVLVVRRQFPAGATVYYQYSVLGASRGARVLGAHEVRSAHGEIVKRLDPRPIAAAPDGSLQRFASLAMRGLPAGDYQLVLRVTDDASGRTIEILEPFTLLPPGRSP